MGNKVEKGLSLTLGTSTLSISVLLSLNQIKLTKVMTAQLKIYVGPNYGVLLGKILNMDRCKLVRIVTVVRKEVQDGIWILLGDFNNIIVHPNLNRNFQVKYP